MYKCVIKVRREKDRGQARTLRISVLDRQRKIGKQIYKKKKINYSVQQNYIPELKIIREQKRM